MINIQKNYNNKQELYRWLSLILITILTVIVLSEALLVKPKIIGEVDDYLLPTISLQNRGTSIITQSDIEQAKIDFPSMYDYLKSCFENESPVLVKLSQTERHSHYFMTYSVACIPMKYLLKSLNLNQEYCAQITNALMYIFTLIIVYKKLKQNKKNVFLAILLLAINPVLFYIIWPSAEVMIFCCVTISLVYFANKSHKLAGIWVSIAGTLNATIMIYGAIIIVDYFIEIFKKEKCRELREVIQIILKKFKDIMMLGFCFIPSLIPFIYNFYIMGTFNPTFGMASTVDFWKRFFAYLFDLNLGMLPYYNIAFVLFIILSVIGMLRRDLRTYLYMVSFYGTIAAVSLAMHINCGMSGVSRYAVWIFPIAIIYLVTSIDEIFWNKKINKWFKYILSISVIFIGMIIVKYNIVGAFNTSYTSMTPIAQKVLDYFPALYNPYEYTFVSRVENVDGGYYYEKPVIYTNQDGYVRKILVDADTADQVLDMVVGAPQEREQVKGQVEKIKNKKGFNYINLSSKTKIMRKPLEQFNPKYNKDISKVSVGVYPNEGDYHWLTKEASIYLAEGNKKTKGVRLNYTTNDAIFKANKDRELNVDVYINGILVKTAPLLDSGMQELIIPGKDLPDTENGVYKIDIKVNGIFIPSEMAEEFGEGNLDSRELSIQLYYLGEN